MVAVLRRCRCARGCSGCCLVRLWGRAAWCARGRRPAREIATREPAARSGRSRGPPRPCRLPPAPWPCPPCPPAPFIPVGPAVLCVVACRLDARPGPAAAHRHRGRVLHALRRPSHLWGLRCCVWWRVVLMPAPALPPPTGTVAGLFSACLPSRPTKPAAYVDRCAPRALAAPPVVGVLRYTKLFGGVSSACRTPLVVQFPRVAAVIFQFGVVWCTKRGPHR